LAEPVKITVLLLLTTAAVSAQTDSAKLLSQGLKAAVAGLSPVSEKDQAAITAATAALLSKHVTFRPDGIVTSICSASGKLHLEWQHLVINRIAEQAVSDADKLNGISRRYLAILESDAHRNWDAKKNAWSEWRDTGYVLFPNGITVEWTNGGWTARETDQLKWFTPGPGASITAPKADTNSSDLPPGMSRGK
jgi:hypothetical protein